MSRDSFALQLSVSSPSSFHSLWVFFFSCEYQRYSMNKNKWSLHLWFHWLVLFSVLFFMFFGFVFVFFPTFFFAWNPLENCFFPQKQKGFVFQIDGKNVFFTKWLYLPIIILFRLFFFFLKKNKKKMKIFSQKKLDGFCPFFDWKTRKTEKWSLKKLMIRNKRKWSQNNSIPY